MNMTPKEAPTTHQSLLLLARDLDALGEALRAAARPLAEPGISVLGAWVGPGAPGMEAVLQEGLPGGRQTFTLVQSFSRWQRWALIRLECTPGAGVRELREAIFDALQTSGDAIFHPILSGEQDLTEVVGDLERMGSTRSGRLGAALPALQETPGAVVLRRMKDGFIRN